ncbi:hypothetical protein C9927_04060 [Pseudidiomarina aestuarii]|uniref:ATP-binding protein n=1 Tax=Pseudidiomarina aestuarii TaxID=624146 RepID=A0A2T4D7Q7_9GAMM|nr:hypothetical protein C9927_04060 [Pseudidiomarina aestuarii]PTB89853.1 hypothetical protein C9928_01885 [Pseudidiomarina aestuarii]
MKKPRDKHRQYIVRLNLRRRQTKRPNRRGYSRDIHSPHSRSAKKQVLRKIDEFRALNVEVVQPNKRSVEIWLPETMNFSRQYEITTSYIKAIRYFVERTRVKGYKVTLRSVRFDRLKKVSSSAALVLTSEISRWDDKVSNTLSPDLSKWSPEIVRQFQELGYFKLFSQSPKLPEYEKLPSVNLLPYIKGTCGDHAKSRLLKSGIQQLLGRDIQKWTFLHSGLGEAITNVSHHAYPTPQYDNEPKNWYLTASFDKNKRELKVSFYDQGIGIPNTLPSSTMNEYVLKYLRRLKLGRHDAIMIRAALAYGRSRTHEEDRGKGLQDMLNFIRQVGNGYLSIISVKGLCKVDIEQMKESVKTHRFENALPGTLIIWSVAIP